MTGIEPAQPAWKAGTLPIELHPRERRHPTAAGGAVRAEITGVAADGAGRQLTRWTGPPRIVAAHVVVSAGTPRYVALTLIQQPATKSVSAQV